MKTRLLYLFLLLYTVAYAQTGTIKGFVKNTEEESISGVEVYNQKNGTVTDNQGFFQLEIPAEKEYSLTFKHLTYQTVTQVFRLKKGETLSVNIILESQVESIEEVKITTERKNVDGITDVKIETAKNIPSPNSGIESTLKATALGASSDNELSSQYKVRGGNYDENLVYVNGIEIYRPFLIRSGQQEGLSFVNPDMTANVKFSSGGFQAKYGDKLSSVLDITYRKPENFGLSTELSLRGASLTLEGINKSKKTTALLGMRYHNNSLFIKSQDINTNYRPRFADVQTLVSHLFNPKWSIDFLGNFAINDYQYIPTTRTTKFGTLQDPLELVVFYDGRENDRYLTTLGALKFQFVPHPETHHWIHTLTTSVFNTQEQEFFDIEAFYSLGNPNTDARSDVYGETENIEEIGSQIDHARNSLDALIANIEFKSRHQLGQNSLEFGLKYQWENIKDQLIEWQVIDSAGFAVRPPGHIPNSEPYEPFEGSIIPFLNLRSQNQTDINRLSGFVQWNHKWMVNGHEITANAGIRAHQWHLEEYTSLVWSPRAQISLKPHWKKEVIFRLSGGNYAQPPMYKELRDAKGNLVNDVKAQQSYHVVLGGDYPFKKWNRAFTLVTEVYYKHLFDVNPYTLDNVRIRYAAANNAVAYAYGFDLRINGEFVPGTESWFNFGYLKTEENIDNRGYISRPGDQRLKFALLFQDYVPAMPNLKMYLNLVYNTGVPGGSPSYADPYNYEFRLSDYKRADLGVSYIFKDQKYRSNHKIFNLFKECSVGGEIFNLFDMQNAITNTWVRNIYNPNQQFGVKNYMTGRVFNLKVRMAF